MNEDAQTQPADPATDVEKAVDEAKAEQPAGPFYSLIVQWAEGTDQDERDRVFAEHLADFAREVGASPEDHLSLCIEAVTVQRIH